MKHIRILSAITLLSSLSCAAPPAGVANYNNPYVAVNVQTDEDGAYFLTFLTVSNAPLIITRNSVALLSHMTNGSVFGLSDDLVFSVHRMPLGQEYHVPADISEELALTHGPLLRYQVLGTGEAEGYNQEHTITRPTTPDLTFAVLSDTANTKSWKDVAQAISQAHILVCTGRRISLSDDAPNLSPLLTNERLTATKKAIIARMFLEAYLAQLASSHARTTLATKPTVHAGLDWRDVFKEFSTYARCEPGEKPQALNEISQMALMFYRIFCLHDLHASLPIASTHTLLPFSLACVKYFSNFVLINFDTVTHTENPHMLTVIRAAVQKNLQEHKGKCENKTLIMVSSSVLQLIYKQLIDKKENTRANQGDLMRHNEFPWPEHLYPFMEFMLLLKGEYQFKQALLLPANTFDNTICKITAAKSTMTIVHTAGACSTPEDKAASSHQTFKISGKFHIAEPQTRTIEPTAEETMLPPCDIELHPGSHNNSFVLVEGSVPYMVEINNGKSSRHNIT